MYESRTDEKELTEMEIKAKQREGYFHKWVEDLDLSKEIPYIKPIALIEDRESGELKMVDYYLVTFID